MEWPTTKQLVKEFKVTNNLDFRSHVFLDNQYGNSPCFNYDFAETVVSKLFAFAHNFIRNNEEYYPHFSGWDWNLQMECENLRISKLKDRVESVCEDLVRNFVPTYREDGNKIFKYSPEDRAYLFDHNKY